MKLFCYRWGRTSLGTAPLMPGQMSLIVEEVEEGKPFSEVMLEVVKNLTDPNVNALLMMDYILNIIIKSAVDEETFADIKYGLSILDKESNDLRTSIAKTEYEATRETMRRILAYLTIQGIFNAEDFAMSFDHCNVDLSAVDMKEMNKNLLNIVALGNRKNPTTFMISVDAANAFEDEESPLADFFKSKWRYSKNVFTPACPNLKNNFVRTI